MRTKKKKLYTDKNDEFMGAFPMDDSKFIAWIKFAMKILPEYKDLIKSWINSYENQIESSQDRAIVQSYDAAGWIIDKTLGIFIETLANEYDDYSQQFSMEDIRKRWPVDAIKLPLRQASENISEDGPGSI
jgi:hypothetical protein